MFDRDKKKALVHKQGEASMTVIGPGIVIEGRSFSGTGTARIDGKYLGDMSIDGNVIVGLGGEIKGNVFAETMLVSGSVIGNIICRGELHLTETAAVEGIIQTASLVVDNGAGINGTINTRTAEEITAQNIIAIADISGGSN